jgi:GT2 family glycosyltransferase
VTYNRRRLLLDCLRALAAQTRRPECIVVVDNASTDGTVDALREAGWLDDTTFSFLRLPENTGGAGGFEAGISRALALGAHWVWLMDDDALPHPEALQALLEMRPDPSSLYGSVAVQGSMLAWPMQRADQPGSERIEDLEHAPASCKVQFLPFLGFLISADMVQRIGLPDGSFFLAADDVEYCLRARQAGAPIQLVRASVIEHPLARLTTLRLGRARIYNLRLPPWKRYYDVRNRLIVARRHHGWALWYSTIPSTIVRLMLTLLVEPERVDQCKAFAGGFIDGLLDKRGRRHEVWLGSRR